MDEELGPTQLGASGLKPLMKLPSSHWPRPQQPEGEFSSRFTHVAIGRPRKVCIQAHSHRCWQQACSHSVADSLPLGFLHKLPEYPSNMEANGSREIESQRGGYMRGYSKGKP